MPTINNQVNKPNSEDLTSLFNEARKDERRNYAALVAERLERLANFIVDESPADIAAIIRDEADSFHKVASGSEV
ncbi:DUF2732 family protein [Limnobaculum xujianqingii]|uniref:DUF2732 family protein n=1 Tax=Limnobaculum xujianqingii TaxID=2738837 RepID=UPI001127AF6C|nr:DUF2732 family protein [Limnobaculum xujianqingii]